MTISSAAAQENPDWHQWGRDTRHHGMAPVAGQRLGRIVADRVYDPFVERERAEQFGVLGSYDFGLARTAGSIRRTPGTFS